MSLLSLVPWPLLVVGYVLAGAAVVRIYASVTPIGDGTDDFADRIVVCMLVAVWPIGVAMLIVVFICYVVGGWVLSGIRRDKRVEQSKIS